MRVLRRVLCMARAYPPAGAAAQRALQIGGSLLPRRSIASIYPRRANR